MGHLPLPVPDWEVDLIAMDVLKDVVCGVWLCHQKFRRGYP